MSTRIGIMALGNLRCIGTPHHLKTKYGHGFSLVVNLLPNLGEEFAIMAVAVDNFIQERCKGSKILFASGVFYGFLICRHAYVLH